MDGRSRMQSPERGRSRRAKNCRTGRIGGWQGAAKRGISGILAFVLTASVIFSWPMPFDDIYAATATRSNARREQSESRWATASNAKYKDGKSQDVDIYIIADDNEVMPGNETQLTLYLKNNTDEPVTDGELRFSGRYIKDEDGYFTDMTVETSENEEMSEGETISADEEMLEVDGEAFGGNEEDFDEAEEEEEPDRLEGIDLEPGELYEVIFTFYTDADLDEMKNTFVEFRFTGEQDAGKVHSSEKFYYGIGMPFVEMAFAEGEQIESGVLNEMNIWLREPAWYLDDWDQEDEDLASASEARVLAKGESLADLASDSDADLASDSDAGKTENTENMQTGEEQHEEILQEAMAIEESRVSYQVEVYGTSFRKFRPKKNTEAEDIGWISCLYEVSRYAQPGIYYGKVTAKGKWHRKSFTTSQGFFFEVTGEGTISLAGELNGMVIEAEGPASSFPEAEDLYIAVSEIDQEKKAMVDEALRKKAEEEGTAIEKYKAVDIKLYADGEETEPEGPIQVAFRNVELTEKVQEAENTETAPPAEAAEAPNGKTAKAAASRMTVQEAAVQNADGNLPDSGSNGQDIAVAGEIKVFHLDEEEKSVSEMSSGVDANGDVLMETDHFSIYIVVDMDQLGGQINLTVQHWATVTQLEGVDGGEGLVESGPANGKPNDATASLKSKQEFTSIYTDDVIRLDNKLVKNVEELSKVLLADANQTIKNYELKELWVLKSGKDSGSINRADWDIYQAASNAPIILSADSTVRMVYNPVTASGVLEQPVTFYDYNVTTGDTFWEDGNEYAWTDCGVNSHHGDDGQWTGGDESNQIAVGMQTVGIYHDRGDAKTQDGEFVNRGQLTGDGFNVAEGMVTGIDENGPIYNGLYDTNLFNDKPVNGKQVITDHKLVFGQEGDTYTLQRVENGSGNTVLDNLDTLREIYDNKEKHIFSNNFWPLDSYEYWGRDPLFGDGKIRGASNKNNEELRSGAWINDDGVAHNWFFGMRYDFEFSVGDYTGPMTFYFRGDDDFWLFVDGELRVDLGGIHSSVGKLLDLSDLRTEAEKNEVHRISIIYAERGGFGSSCYMKFTLPNVKPVSFDTDVPKTNVAVIKEWDDADNPYRPSGIQVTLSYREDGSSEWKNYETVTMTGTGDTWEYEWAGLPADGYSYKVEEVSGLGSDQDGYQVVYSPGDQICQWNEAKQRYEITITNSLNPRTAVLVTKTWDDENNQDGNRPENVAMQLLWREAGSENKWAVFPGDNGRLILDGTADQTETDEGQQPVTLESGVSGEYEAWKGIFAGLPVYIRYEGKRIEMEYTVREMNGTFQIQEGGKLPGKNSGNDWEYTVTYTEAEEKNFSNHVTVTNTYIPKTTKQTVKKIWVDEGNISSGEVKAGLYEVTREEGKDPIYTLADRTQEDNPITLTRPDNLTHTWAGLPVYRNGQQIEYAVYELDAEGKPVTVSPSSVKLGDGYQYEVSFEVNNGTTTITNKLETALLRIQKIVEGNGLPSEPIDDNYKFLIQVKQDDNVYASVALGHQEISGSILLTPPEDGESFQIEEIVPMEYTLTSMVSDKPGSLAGGENGSTITVKPGDNILVTLTNKPEHSGYFHHTASVTNEKDLSQDGNFTQMEDGIYTEPHGKSESSGGVTRTAFYSREVAAVLEDPLKTRREKRMEKGDDLNG